MKRLLKVMGVIATATVLAILVTPRHMAAAVPAGCPGGPAGPPAPGTVCPGGVDSNGNPTATSSSGVVKCGNVSVSFDVGCTGSGNPIYDYLRAIIKFMAGIFGILAVLMVVISGLQYMASGGNPEAIKKAKNRLFNVVLSIILFGMMFGILHFIIPGSL